MKKWKIAAAAAVVLLAAGMLLTGCGSQADGTSSAAGAGSAGSSAESADQAVTMEEYLSAWKAEDWGQAEQIASEMPQMADEACVSEMSDEQMAAFRKIVKEVPLDMNAEDGYLWGYYLTDVDNDGVCDLIMDTGTCEADRIYTIYLYVEGNAHKYQEFPASHSVPSAYPDHDGFVVNTGHMGTQYVTVASMADRESLEFPYYEIGDDPDKDYVTVPLQLDSHISYTEDNDPVLDLSPLEE